jgi:hypothetical protein
MRRVIGAFSVVAVLVVVLAGPASAASHGRTVVARINGGGTAEMQEPLPAGTTHWGAGVTLYSDGTASGQIDCVDQHGDWEGFPGNIWGEVTTWSEADGVISLNVVGKFHPIPGGPGHLLSPATFTVRIQQFGGAGVGRWTLEDTDSGFIFCYELITSGQIAIRWA